MRFPLRPLFTILTVVAVIDPTGTIAQQFVYPPPAPTAGTNPNPANDPPPPAGNIPASYMAPQPATRSPQRLPKSDPVTNPATVPSASPTAPTTTTPPTTLTAPAIAEPALTIATIESKNAQWQGSPTLTAELKARIADECKKAIQSLTEASELTAKITSLRNESSVAISETQRLQNSLAKSAEPAVLPDEIASWDGDKLRAANESAESRLDELRQRHSSLQNQIEWRTNRVRALPDLISQARAKFEEASQSLQSFPPSDEPNDEPKELTEAKRLRIEASRQFRSREWESLHQETKTYADSARAMNLHRDLADREIKAAQRYLTAVAKLLADWEKRQADQRAIAARTAVSHAHPAVRAAARVNTELAETNAKLVAAMETARTELAAAESTREELRESYANTRERAKEANFSQAIGMMLRSQQAELPDIQQYRSRAAKRAQDQADLNFKLLEWETQRRLIQSVDEAVDQHLSAVGQTLEPTEKGDVRGELNQVLSARLNLYAELSANARDQLGRLASLETAEEELATEIKSQAAFISQHILWVRSTAPLTPSLLSPLVTGAADLVKAKAWLGVWSNLRSQWQLQPLFLVMALPLIWLLVDRRRLQAKLDASSQDAQRLIASGMAPTLHTILLTACLAIPTSGLVALLGWRLTTVAAVGDFSFALGNTLVAAGCAFAALRFIFIACRTGGLAQAHFGWDQDVTVAIRRATAMAKATSLPAAFVSLFCVYMSDELLISTVGRVALILSLLSLATISLELFRSGGPIAKALVEGDDTPWTRWGYRVGAGALVIVPLVLAFVSAIGFHYTAARLSTRMAATWGAVALLVGLRGVALRWLTIVYRRVAYKRAKERLAAIRQTRLAAIQKSGPAAIQKTGLAAIQKTGLAAADATVDPHACSDPSLETDLSDVNRQSQRLIRIAVTILGGALLMLIWRDILPALGYLNRFELWTNGVASPGEDGAIPRVTLVDLFLGGGWLALTYIACRNLPGLLDISLFQRLPLDAGARYAAGALTQYLLVVIGAIASFRQIGIGWQSVQWLVAAMTVGLGFGLQEIFANFVSGIILLFERPVRVGDTVTIGNVSGTVTRIRIRATTVQDWDNKELIVPNRDFVTGNLVNWTLSSPNLRVVIQVGIAYGSDTRLATKLLYEVASKHPLVLPDPAPVVVFSNFGASSLDFELRVFACGLLNSRLLRHDLHMAIDDAFREHKIEIAFPQQDVYVRSLPQTFLERLTEPPPPAAEPPAAIPLQVASETTGLRKQAA